MTWATQRCSKDGEKVFNYSGSVRISHLSVGEGLRGREDLHLSALKFRHDQSLARSTKSRSAEIRIM